MFAGIARLLALLCLVCPLFSLADDAGSSTRIFVADDFTQFAPQTALDMVERIPGFQVSEVDDDRGLGQASGNVLVNGDRVSGKSNGPIEALTRIPADSVERIDVLDGATLGIPGLSGEVVNVIAETSAVRGTWSYQFQRRRSQDPRLWRMEAALVGGSGQTQWNIAFRNDAERRGFRGGETVTDGAGRVIEHRLERGTFYHDQPILSGGLSWNGESGAALNANLAYTQFLRRGLERSLRAPGTEDERQRDFRSSEDEWNVEASGDFAIPLPIGRLKFIGLYRFEDSPTVSQVDETARASALVSGSRFARNTDEGERIGRIELDVRQGLSTWQIAAEGAFNFLDVEAFLTESDDFGTLVPVALDDAESRVEERRSEFSISHTRVLSPTLSLQASVGGEISELTQTGEGGLTRRFTRPNGFFAVTWQPNTATTLLARMEREVGQLNFGDFVASVNLNEEFGNAGNPDLVPQQANVLELRGERAFGARGAASLTLYYEDIQDIVDRIPVGDDGDAAGNLESASRYGMSFSGTWRRWGLPGGQLEISSELRKSRVVDPVSGQSRRINNDVIASTNVELRQDLPDTPWAWGVEYFRDHRAPVFRLDEARFRESSPSFVAAYLEHKDVFGMIGRFRVGNINDHALLFRREVFDVNRTGDLAFTESRARRFGNIFELTLSGAF